MVQFLGTITMLLVAGSVWGSNVQMSVDVASRVHLLHRLVAAGQKGDLARLLPQLKKHIDSGDYEGHTPLHWAVYEDDIESAKLLLLHEANPNLFDGYGRTALHEAARLGSNEMLTLMMGNGGEPKVRDQRNNWGALLWAAFSGKKETLQTLMQHVDVDEDVRAANNMDIYGIVLQQDDQAKMRGEDTDKMEKVKILLDAGIAPDIGMAMMIVPLGVMTPLAELFESYEDKIAFNTRNINAADNTGRFTLLMKTMMAGSIATMELLLRQGAKIDAVNANGENTLASQYSVPEHLEIAKLLIRKGINVRNGGGSIAFYSALINDDVELAKLLLESVTEGESGKEPVPEQWFIFNTPNSGATPVMKLAKSQDMQALLADYGLDRPSKNVKMVEKLQQRGAQRQVGDRQLPGESRAASVPNFLIDFNALAAQGKFKPIIGREQEIQQVITALARKEKNNPLLVGEAGVGKTAIVEGLAQRIVAGDVPAAMQGKTIYALDMGKLQASNMFHGALADLLDSELLPFIEKSEGNAILFIDEVHQLISSRGLEGMADLLKPALARGDLHCIGATTQNEYQQYIMKDKALERRFLPVTVEEPLLAETIAIVNGLKNIYEQHHGVSISADAMQGAVKLADRYITDRFHPDKAIDLIDMAAAKLAVNEGREQELQLKHVAEIVAEITRVPVERMLMGQQEKVEQLPSFLRQHIFGQDRVLGEISRYLSPFIVGIGDQDRPASMLLLGPTGVGKTETAKVLAEYFFGARDNLININLSEYREKHDVTSLIGAPSSYIGYEQGGILTEAVRRKPFSVVLFDEIGEAHPEFAGILLKILDEGELTDKKGVTINFRNTIIVITGNTAANKASSIGFQEETEEPPSAVSMSEVPFKDKVHGRLGKVLVYDPLPPEVMGKLVDKELARFNTQLEQNDISISLTSTLRKHLQEKGYNPALGARSLQKMFEESVESHLSLEIAAGKLKKGKHYRIGLRSGEITITEKPAP